MEKDIKQMKNMLRAVVNSQSSLREDMNGLKEELLNEIKNFREENAKEHQEINERLDKQGKQLAYLEDDLPAMLVQALQAGAPTREEHDELEKRVNKLEEKISN